ncbi:hypothetical protein TanjilG_12586 [Lupinus angustifolius]|uniref:DOG1 domain-containing protein n=1 Tax=Lupinus angustifolius TaxID=3871 RepID=A0A4P1QYS0_LUPAN|nr:PREDICTED: protein DOG1-like 4 [Lupinus angustifolius]OIV97829.1 hypothetical protein TanjilG_12586 [Lupinus angustifolius]
MKVEEEWFQHFFEGWLLQMQNLLDQLLNVLATPDSVTKTEHQNHLIKKVLSHYEQYIEAKAKVAEADVLLMLSPTWLSAYEKSLLWIGDYKPSLILRLANDAVEGLNVRQREMLEKMMSAIRRVEREIGTEMARVQESVASPEILGLVRKVGRVMNGEICQMDSTVEGIKIALVGVVKKADEVRVSTVREVVEMLTPPQTVHFLAAVTEFQLRVRRLGLERDQVVESC